MRKAAHKQSKKQTAKWKEKQQICGGGRKEKQELNIYST